MKFSKTHLIAVFFGLASSSALAGGDIYFGRCGSGGLFIFNAETAGEHSQNLERICGKGDVGKVLRLKNSVENRAELNKLLLSRGLKTLEQLEAESNERAAANAIDMKHLLTLTSNRPLGLSYTRDGVRKFISQDEMSGTPGTTIEVTASGSAR